MIQDPSEARHILVHEVHATTPLVKSLVFIQTHITHSVTFKFTLITCFLPILILITDHLKSSEDFLLFKQSD